MEIRLRESPSLFFWGSVGKPDVRVKSISHFRGVAEKFNDPGVHSTREASSWRTMGAVEPFRGSDVQVQLGKGYLDIVFPENAVDVVTHF